MLPMWEQVLWIYQQDKIILIQLRSKEYNRHEVFAIASALRLLLIPGLGYKTSFMLNYFMLTSTEHKIYPAHNVKMPTIHLLAW